MSEPTSETPVDNQSDPLEIATEIVTLIGAIISTWYLADLASHGELNRRLSWELRRLRDRWEARKERQRYLRNQHSAVWWAEEYLREVNHE